MLWHNANIYQTLNSNSCLQFLTSFSDGTLRNWKNECYDTAIQPIVKPYHACPYPIPKVHEATLKMEI
jgi:hypothetical protein